MANMSYCRFQNTLHDLRDCIWALEDGELENGGSEIRSAIEMLEACKEYIDLEYKINEIIEEHE